MSSKAIVCPQCEAETIGKFCGECGEKIRTACSSCGTEASPGARFCQQCGASFSGAAGAAGAARAKDTVPWIAVGGVGIVLAVVGAFMILDRQDSATPSTTPATSAASVTTTPNITPEEAADQLFNHVMTASEGGDNAEVQRFAPMALAAYDKLGTLDNDAHYHVGLIYLSVSDIEPAQAELDAIRRSVPNHLLGMMLEHGIAEAKGDDAGAAEAYVRFLSVYDTEILTARGEYEGHRKGIDGFRARASAAVALR